MAGMRVALGAAVFGISAVVIGGLALTAGGTTRALVCGDIVSGSVKLTSDLTCTGNGLIVGAANTKLDLGGHTITGDGGSGDIGVYDDGFGRVTISNGTIGNFDTGVRLNTAPSSTLTRLVVRAPVGFGLLVEGGTSLRIADNVVVRAGVDGIWTTGSATIEKNRVVATAGDYGILAGGAGDVVKGNVVSAGFIGIRAAAANILVTGNTVLASSFDGIQVGAEATAVSKNDIRGAGHDGISVGYSDGTLVTGNTVTGATAAGIRAQYATNVTVIKNTVTGGVGSGVVYYQASGDVSGNTVTGNRDGGIRLCDAETLSRNTVKWNKNHGFQFGTNVVDQGGETSIENDYDNVLLVLC